MTVDAESWLGALNKARGGIALARYHAEIEDDGTVRVLDRNTRDRFTVRQMKSHAPERPTSSAPPPEPARPQTPPVDAPLSFGAPADAPLFFGGEAPAGGLFSDSQPPKSASPTPVPDAPGDRAGMVAHRSVTVLKGDGTQAPVSMSSKSTLGPGVHASASAAMSSTPARSSSPEVTRGNAPPAATKSATATQPDHSTTSRGHVPPASSVIALALDYDAPHTTPAPSETAEPPKAEPPKAEPLKVEPAKAEPPKAEPPKAEPPKVEAPKVEAPKAEAPKAEATKVEAPKAESPKVETPKQEPADDAGIVIEDAVLRSLNGASHDNTRSDTMVVPTVVGGDEPVEALPVPTVLYERDDDPSSGSPITYRERVFAVAEGTPPARAEALARQAFASIKRSLVTRARGRFVTIAVFDHEFEAHPKRPPLVVLQWKDWRGDVVVEFPPRDAPMPATPAIVSVPPAAVVAAPEAKPTPPAPKPPTPPTKPVPQASPVVPAKALEPREKKLSKNKRKRARTNSEARIPTAAATDAIARPATPAQPLPAAPATAERDMPTVVVPVFVAPDAPATPAVEQKAEPAAPAPVAEAPVVEAPAPQPEATVAPAVTEAAAAPVDSAPAPVEKAPEAVVEKASEVVEKTPEVVVEKTPEKAPEVVVEKAPEKAPDVVVEKAPEKAPEATRSVALTGKRRRGKDLVSDLFDALMDLSFAQSPEDACAFAARVIRDTVLVDACSVSVYDIDRDEFIVSASEGGPAVGTRVKAKGGHRGVAVRKHASVNVKVCEPSEAFSPSYMGAPALFAASYHRDRLFAMVIIQRMRGGPVFESDEEDGVNYVASQLAEALSTHSRRAAAAEYGDQKPGARSTAPKRR